MRRAVAILALVAFLTAGARDASSGAGGRQDFPLSWSPDGRVIVFERSNAPRGGDFAVGPDGRGLRRMPAGTDFAWSRDGRLAFSRGGLRYAGIAAGGIFVRRGLDAPARRLTWNDGFADSSPRWSPDGRWIVFSRTRYRRAGPGSFAKVVTNDWLVRPDGTGLHRVSLGRGSDWAASWAPDSRHVVLARASGRGQSDLYVSDVRTQRERRLTYGGDNGDPRWSPCGGSIVFMRAHDLDRDSDVQIWSIRPDGRRLRNLTPFPGENQAPVWSPDCRWIAFEVDSRRPNPSDIGALLEIWLMRPDGSGQHPLFRHLRRDALPDDQGPVWSPDSRRIAFARFDPGGDGMSLHVARLDGTHALRLTY